MNTDDKESIGSDLEYTRRQDAFLNSLFGSSFEQEFYHMSSSEPVTLEGGIRQRDEEMLPLVDEEDRLILMHRDAHFGGSFPLMISYYQNDEKGVQQEISLQRIENLYAIEQNLGKNLAPLLLEGNDAELVAKSRALYKALRELFENNSKDNILVQAIADAILSENQEIEDDVTMLVSHGEQIIPYLIDLATSSIFSDPLFPGYGLASKVACLALGKLRAETAISSLFQLIGSSIDLEDAVLSALKDIGEKAKIFCLKQLKGRPVTEENIRAAIALFNFSYEEDVASEFFNELKEQAPVQNTRYLQYLVLGCEMLPQNKRADFIHLAQDIDFCPEIREEMQLIARSWK